ncbi:MAG: class I SAM-dependent methyltransferase [Thermoguttaceae bacterium]
MKSTTEITGNIYDYPSYYDVIFTTAWKAEYTFIRKCFELHAKGPVQRVFEPACGTGRFLWRLAKDRFTVSGLDLNPKAVNFCNRRMRRHGFDETAFLGDISVDLKLHEPIDAAFNMVSSFCHLTTEKQAEKHLQLIAESLRPGGIYILGFHLKPKGVAECDSESWRCRHGSLSITSDLRSVSRDEKKRIEIIEFRICAESPIKVVNLFDRFEFRTYTHQQFLSLLKKINSLENVACYNFGFEPITLDEYSEDVIFVLRKKG